MFRFYILKQDWLNLFGRVIVITPVTHLFSAIYRILEGLETTQQNWIGSIRGPNPEGSGCLEYFQLSRGFPLGGSNFKGISHSSHLKIDGKGKTFSLPFEGSFLAGALAVNFRKGKSADDFSSWECEAPKNQQWYGTRNMKFVKISVWVTKVCISIFQPNTTMPFKIVTMCITFCRFMDSYSYSYIYIYINTLTYFPYASPPKIYLSQFWMLFTVWKQHIKTHIYLYTYTWYEYMIFWALWQYKNI